MSLFTTARMFAGHEQSDEAALVANGIHYRCTVILSRVDWSIAARCTATLPSGDEVDVFHNLIVRATALEISDTNGVPLDCPKIVAVDTTFVVHWLQATDIDVGDPIVTRDWALHRALMDMTAFSATTWSAQGSVPLRETHALYDVAVVTESDPQQFVVARVVDDAGMLPGRVAIARFESPYSWVDTVWSTNHDSDENIAACVLGIHAHETDNDVVISYQRVEAEGGGLYSWRLNADDGTSAAVETLTFPLFEAAAEYDNEGTVTHAVWLQISHERVAARRFAIAGEARAAIMDSFLSDVSTADWIHHFVERTIDSSDVSNESNEHWTPNVYMASRLFSYADGTSASAPGRDVYVMLTYRAITESHGVPDDNLADDVFPAPPASEWSQAYAYVCNLDLPLWDTVDDGAGLRPRPVMTITGDSIGIPDARASGWHPEASVNPWGVPAHVASPNGGPTKRRNHLPHASAAPPYGPDVKSRSIPLTFFTTIGTISDVADTDGDGSRDDLVQSTQPDWAGVRGIVFHIENPWAVHRDFTDPTQPTDNFSGPYPRAMHQTAPWGRGLFIAGGTPQLYDGESLVEVGFPWHPEIVGYNTAAFGRITNGTRFYCAVYTWIDRQGQLHRSAPSNVLTVTLDASDDEVILYVRCVNLSLKDATAFYPLAQSINIEIFRTVDSLSTFYRVFGNTVPGATFSNRPRDTSVNLPEQFAGYLGIRDGVSDAELVLQGEGPYQLTADGFASPTGPVPVVWPACHSPALHQNRIVVADALDPTRFFYSDENIPTEGAATYSAPVTGTALFFRTGEIHETTGFQSQGPVMVQFTRDKVFALGATQSDTVVGGLNWTSNIIHDALGCVDPKTIVLFPMGIGFQSRKGYYVLARSGEASYGVLERSRDQPRSLGGAAVEDDIALMGNVRSASHSPSEHRIDLVGNGRPAVVSTWTGTISVGADSAGAWTISGLSQAVSDTAPTGLSASQVGDRLQVAILALIAASAPTTLRFQVASVSSPGAAIVLVLETDVEVTLTGDGPGAGTITFVRTQSITTRPWILRYHYDVEQWSRAELPQTNAITRLSELVDGCYWEGDARPRHVALAQGQLLIERLESDALAYADQTASANVGVPIDLTTAWIHIAGIAGAQALDEIVVQTERDEQDDVFATLEYDFDGSYTGQTIPNTEYDWPQPGSTTPADLRVRPRHRRGRAFRLRVYEDSTVTTAGRTISILQFVVVVGVLPGVTKVNPTQRGAA